MLSRGIKRLPPKKEGHEPTKRRPWPHGKRTEVQLPHQSKHQKKGKDRRKGKRGVNERKEKRPCRKKRKRRRGKIVGKDRKKKKKNARWRKPAPAFKKCLPEKIGQRRGEEGSSPTTRNGKNCKKGESLFNFGPG